jgi:hypothetical protein
VATESSGNQHKSYREKEHYIDADTIESAVRDARFTNMHFSVKLQMDSRKFQQMCSVTWQNSSAMNFHYF